LANSALIIGCGYLGSRVGRAWLDRGYTVRALTRGRAASLESQGFEPITGDVLIPASLRDLPVPDTILYAVGMDRSAGRSMREVYIDGLRNVLAALPRGGRFFSVSSTSVYGQTDGSLVTEADATEPLEGNGRIVLEAERALREFRPDATILRFAGIYGPGRLLRRAQMLKDEAYLADPEKWLNLIHVEDGVRAVLAAERAAVPGGTFNIADDNPVSRRDFYTELARLLGAPPARFEPAGSPAREANRRISNARAKAELGFAPEFPSYREGLRASL
jgi:nucleoside-diphosphate-sugar epimerase